jgi:hypothetical protein
MLILILLRGGASSDSRRYLIPVLITQAGEQMAGGRFSLDQALARVVDQYNMLKYLYEVNPEHVLEFPADKTLLDILKAAAPHVPKTDSVAETLELFIMEGQNRAPVFKVSQLLPFIMALQGALQDKVNRRDTRRLKQSGSSQDSSARKSPTHRLQSPPSLPQYRPESPSDRRNELLCNFHIPEFNE